MMKRIVVLGISAFGVSGLACSSSATPAGGGQTGKPDASPDEGGTTSTACSFDVSGTTFPYDCPDTATAAKCNEGNATVCKAGGGKTPGAVAAGGDCQVADSFELGDDCASIPSRASAATPKGSICFTFTDAQGPSYCTHLCTSAGDCADVGTQCALVSQGGTKVCKK